MSRDNKQKQGIKGQNQRVEMKKNRISFKQFQQHYEDHVETQKQKRKSQQQSLNKLAIKNTKPLQSVDKENQPNQINYPKQVLTSCNSKKQIKPLTLSQINSLNSSVNVKSCFVSPKASSQMFIKSINLASNKSKQSLPGKNYKNQLSSYSRPKAMFLDNKKNTLMINLNCGKNSQNDIMKGLKAQKIETKESSSNLMSKNSSLTQMNIVELNEGSLTSYGSKRIFKEQDNYLNPNTYQILTQQMNSLSSQLQFLNQFFKEIQPQEQHHEPSQSSHFTYKIKLINQIRSKLTKLSSTSFQSQNSMQLLLSNILQLLESYQNDLKRLLSSTKNSFKTKKLEILIDGQDKNEFLDENQNRFVRQQSRKKTVKLSRSRRTNEQTIHTQSIVHPFETSEFSLLNTSKITDISRPSSQNKERTKYHNEIQNIINSKILSNPIQIQNRNEEQRLGYQNQSKVKINIRGNTKSSIETNKVQLSLKLKNEINDEPQIKLSEAGTKKKSVTKIVTLIPSNNKALSVDKKPIQLQKAQKYTSIPKDKNNITRISKQNISHEIDQINNLTIKNILDKNKQKRQNEEKKVSDTLEVCVGYGQNKKNNQKTTIPETRPSFASHNDSIFELEYLENYSSQNHIQSINSQIDHLSNTNHYQAPNNISWKQNTYSSQLFR